MGVAVASSGLGVEIVEICVGGSSIVETAGCSTSKAAFAVGDVVDVAFAGGTVGYDVIVVRIVGDGVVAEAVDANVGVSMNSSFLSTF